MNQAVLHTAVLGGHPVRFYRSPLDGPDMAWVAFADVLGVAEFTRDGVDHWIGRWRTCYPELTFDLDDETVIVADAAARGLFDWGVQVGWAAAPELQRQYEEAASLAFCVINVRASGDELRDLARQAGLRNMIFVAGVTHAH